jgi:hypothetical protein
MLDVKNKGYTVKTKRQKFVDQVVDNNYDVVKQQLAGDLMTDFH